MGKKKKRNPSSSSALSPQRYETLLLRLIEAWEMAEEDADVFWDYGPGERPHVIEQQLKTVAQKEAIPVRIYRGTKCLKLAFKTSKKDLGFRVMSEDGELKTEGERAPDPTVAKDAIVQ